MKAIFIAVIACALVLQLTEAKPAKGKKGASKPSEGGMKPIDTDEMMKSCSKECLTFLSQPKNQQKLQTLSNTDPHGFIQCMLDNGCQGLMDYIHTHMQG